METAPILFLIFNRPDTSNIVFKQIKAVRPSKLYIASDGARKDVPGEDIAVESTRKHILEQIDWPCEIKTLFREKNLGCGRAVSSAISWFFSHEEMGIILEDDCLPDKSFFMFCTTLLNYYKDNKEVFQINGSCFLNDLPLKTSYFFSRYNHIWGWATWRRSWNLFNKMDKNFEKTFHTFHFLSSVEKNYWQKIFTKYFSGEIDTWDYPWMFTVWKHNGMSIYPKKNLIKNIGFGDNATHTKKKIERFENMKTEELNKIIHPSKININSYLDEKSFEYVFLNTENFKWEKNKILHEIQHYYEIKDFKKVIEISLCSEQLSIEIENKNIYEALAYIELNNKIKALKAIKKELYFFPENRLAKELANKIASL